MLFFRIWNHLYCTKMKIYDRTLDRSDEVLSTWKLIRSGFISRFALCRWNNSRLFSLNYLQRGRQVSLWGAFLLVGKLPGVFFFIWVLHLFNFQGFHSLKYSFFEPLFFIEKKKFWDDWTNLYSTLTPNHFYINWAHFAQD